jgi:crotonobetainyl-CoA:carnitine CoA-transferase CaiB-like acyl-CoA transferase
MPDDLAHAGLYRPRDSEPGALAGLRVVDLTIARAGPTCVRQLADLGAEVIQVAAPNRLELGGSDSLNLHRGKRSVVIDLKQAEGLEVFLRLVDRADVLVENFRSEVKQRLGIDYETLSQRNPRLVYASISGFGQEGPYASRPGVDQIAQGMSGLMSVTGPPGGGPWRTGIAISDTAAGTLLTQGVLAALLVRARTGRGQWVHTSLLEAMVNFMDFQAARWLVEGEVAGQAGNDHPTIFPMGAFRTRDGLINIAVFSDWAGFARAIDAPELIEDARFSSHASRAAQREALRALIEAKLEMQSSAHWIEALTEAGVACGPILHVDEVFADPQVRHLELTRKVQSAESGELELLRHPVTLSETPAGVRGPPPVQGADTVEVLRELGVDAERIASLRARGVVRQADAPE